ncbi:hypothetical protein B0H13DRAFT_2662817, partial [Mycena leptocephala]
WLIVPQATVGTFTLQSVALPAFFVSYAAAAVKSPFQSQVVGRTVFPLFPNATVGSGPAANLIDNAI